MRRAGALLGVIVSAVFAASASAAPTTPLGHEGRWITDADGRVVTLHGVNMVSKRPPYLPAAAGFDAPDADFLVEHGFNTVRIGLIYKGIEPNPGVYDEAYLDGIAATESLLAQRGIFSQLDFHQDLYNERFQGEGWPDWAVQDDGLPALPQLGFPNNYFGMLALSRAFDHFWANDPGPGGVGLQDRYAAAFRRVAERFASAQHTIGYDLMNEPWPGTPWLTCANPLGCPLFDTLTLAPFHQKVIARIREVEPQKLIWYEPQVLFNFGSDTHHPATGDPATGFSFHVYCLPGALMIPGLDGIACETLDELVMDNADAQAQQTGDPLLLSEFGATDDLNVIRRNVEGAERHMISWQYWHYCECDDPTTQASGGTQSLVIDANQPPAGSNVKEAKLDVLARPYPQVVAGTPQGYDFVEGDKRFDLGLTTTGPGGNAFAPAGGGSVVPASTPQTEVFIPARHYPGGYEADVDGGGIASDPGARVLRVAACPGRGTVEVAVRKPGDGSVDGPDCVVEGARRTRLRLKLRPRAVAAAERSCFTATVRTRERTRVEGARVFVNGRAKRTNRRGRARLCTRFDRPGRYRVKAKKLGYKRARRTLKAHLP
jgi:endoglycosylceramidase